MQLSGNANGILFERQLFQQSSVPFTGPEKDRDVVQSADVESSPLKTQSLRMLSKSASTCLSALLTVPGNLSIMFGAVNLVVVGTNSDHSQWSYGIWCGVFSVVSGSLFKAASESKVLIMVKASALAACFGFIFALIQLAISCSFIADFARCQEAKSDSDYCDGLSVTIVFASMLLVTGIFQLIFGIWVFIICCKVFCCRKSTISVTPSPTSHEHAESNPSAFQMTQLPPQTSAVDVITRGGYTQPPSDQSQPQDSAASSQPTQGHEAAVTPWSSSQKEAKTSNSEAAKIFLHSLKDGFEKAK